MKQSKLHIDKVLEYVDEPQLFVARDEFDTMFLCLLFDDNRYTAVRISGSRLQQFEQGQVDLLTIYQQPENDGEYFDVVANDEGQLIKSDLGVLSPERLPGSGYYLTKPSHEKVTVSIPVEDKRLFSSIMRRFGWIAM